MNSNYSQEKPFKNLGTHLKYLREQSRESLAEVSGAVEIDTDELERIEQGSERPSEEILMLMMSHFGMQDQEAVQLWELAGYDRRDSDRNFMEDIRQSGKPIVMLMAVDVRTMFSDGVEITTNKGGLTLSFSQTNHQNQAMPVARVGLSFEQAEETLQALQSALLKAQYLRSPKLLPAPKTAKKPKNN